MQAERSSPSADTRPLSPSEPAQPAQRRGTGPRQADGAGYVVEGVVTPSQKISGGLGRRDKSCWPSHCRCAAAAAAAASQYTTTTTLRSGLGLAVTSVFRMSTSFMYLCLVFLFPDSNSHELRMRAWNPSGGGGREHAGTASKASRLCAEDRP